MRDNLVHMIVHDLRTPLRAANQATVDLIHMVSNLLDISRMEDGKMPLNRRPCNVAELLDQIHKLMNVKAAQNDIQLTVDAPPLEIPCDGELIQRVLVNLTANAIKFSEPDTSARLSTSAEDDQLTINVEDSGPGIPEDYQQKVFEKFGQVYAFENRKKFSTGLSLTFCKLAMEAHDGRIGVHSDGQHGSRFWFTLPLYSEN